MLLASDEIERLASFTSLTPAVFRSRYEDDRWPGKENCLVRKKDDSCPFLEENGKEYLCAVHAIKPQACRNWEAAPSKPECQRGLKKIWQLTINGCGQLEGTPDAIRVFLTFLAVCVEAANDAVESPKDDGC